MNQNKMLISDPPKQLEAIYSWPTLFRVKGHQWSWLFYEIDETDFSESWLLCTPTEKEWSDLEEGHIDVGSVFNAHRNDTEIIRRSFETGKFSPLEFVWDINNDLVWNARLLPKDNWFLDKNKIQYFDSTSNPS